MRIFCGCLKTKERAHYEQIRSPWCFPTYADYKDKQMDQYNIVSLGPQSQMPQMSKTMEMDFFKIICNFSHISSTENQFQFILKKTVP